jgi:hypothetical protein
MANMKNVSLIASEIGKLKRGQIAALEGRLKAVEHLLGIEAHDDASGEETAPAPAQARREPVEDQAGAEAEEHAETVEGEGR